MRRRPRLMQRMLWLRELMYSQLLQGSSRSFCCVCKTQMKWRGRDGGARPHCSCASFACMHTQRGSTALAPPLHACASSEAAHVVTAACTLCSQLTRLPVQPDAVILHGCRCSRCISAVPCRLQPSAPAPRARQPAPPCSLQPVRWCADAALPAGSRQRMQVRFAQRKLVQSNFQCSPTLCPLQEMLRTC
jgi:hypothetical protein